MENGSNQKQAFVVFSCFPPLSSSIFLPIGLAAWPREIPAVRNKGLGNHANLVAKPKASRGVLWAAW
jgi:hypothetical protein